MPTIDYQCPDCGHHFKRVVMRGDPVRPIACPRCPREAIAPVRESEALFEGIAGFSDLAKDTN